MELVVFGANGPTGQQVVRQALATGHRVVAVTRNPKEYPLAAPHLRIAAADVTDAERVSDAVAGAHAVISTYGVPYSRKAITVYSEGITNILHGMRRHSVTRLVCVSSTSVASTKAPGDSVVWRKAVLPFLRNVVGRSLYNDMQLMEEIVRESEVDWTIVRPGGLFNTAYPTSDYETSQRRLAGRLTSRADLAQTLIVEATEPRNSRATIEVITRSELPGPRQFVREAFGVGA